MNEASMVGRWVLGVVTGWGLLALLAARAGLYERIAGPAFAAVVVIGVAAPLVVLALTPALRRWSRGLSMPSLTLLHVWRVPAALVFWAYGDTLPAAFVRNAAWGDFVVGCLAPVVLLLPAWRGKWLAFHAIGAADFVLAVGTGLTLTLLGDPKMAMITTFPLALIPSFGVCLSGVAHVIAFDKLLARSGAGLGSGTRDAVGHPA
jgi:hypothetical protein